MKSVLLVGAICVCLGVLYTQDSKKDKIALYREIGIANYWEFNWAVSIQRLNYVVREDSLDHEAFFYRGLSKGNTGNYPSAIKDFERAIQLHQSNPDYYFKLAESLFKLNRWEKAVFAFDEAIKKAEEAGKAQNLPIMYYEKGIALVKLKSWPSACQALFKAASLGHEVAAHEYNDMCKGSKYEQN